jgi:tetratricopeptide (TPR) repeat protein
MSAKPGASIFDEKSVRVYVQWMMTRFRCSVNKMVAFSNIFKLSCASGALVILQSACYGFDYITAGMDFYDAGDFQKAAEYFYTCAKKSPQNADARYHLANSLVKLGRMQEAFVQYQAAIALKPDSPSADFSRQALLVFKGENAEEAGKKSHEDLIVPSAPRLRDQSQEDEERDIRRAAKAVDIQTGAKESAITEEGAKVVKRIMKEAADKIAALETEKQSEITAATSGLKTAAKDELVKPIEQEYQKRIEVLSKEAKRHSDEVLADCKSRVAALENSATNSSHALIDKKRSGNVRSIPLASNLHVHNYESEEQPSGDPIPSIAQPAKSLQSVVKSDQLNKK